MTWEANNSMVMPCYYIEWNRLPPLRNSKKKLPKHLKKKDSIQDYELKIIISDWMTVQTRIREERGSKIVRQLQKIQSHKGNILKMNLRPQIGNKMGNILSHQQGLSSNQRVKMYIRQWQMSIKLWFKDQ